ncbi:MAG: beta-mannanase, partial [Synergistaceae bacterium]|nr:beta-mannanase [Synergistaceae bacterium]
KPIAILELGVSDPDGTDDKPEWIREAFSAVSSGRYPRLKAVSWWNKVFRPDGKRSTLEIDSSTESLEAYRDGVLNLEDEARWGVR